MIPDDADEPVLASPKGGPLRSANFRSKVWLPAVADVVAEDPNLAGLRIHDLRHPVASMAISVGATIKAVQQMLGHKNASMTLNTYSHLYAEHLEELTNRLDQQYRGVA